MYIPKEVLFFILGFIAFPIMCYVLYKVRGYDKEENAEKPVKQKDK